MTRPLLIIGGEGLLGSALHTHALQIGWPVHLTLQPAPSSAGGAGFQPATASSPVCGAGFQPAITREFLDLTEPLDTWSPPPCHAAILCAAITRLEDCRRDPATTRHLNVTQTLRLATKLLQAGTFVVFPSSNLVFDGTRPLRPPHDPLSPQTEYGRQKAAVEAGLASFSAHTAIVRLTKVIGPQWSLACQWADAWRHHQPIQAFTDLTCAPLPLHLTVQGLLQIAARRLPGLWQFSADTDVPYAAVAQHLARRWDANPSLVLEVSAQTTAHLEHLPRHTTLDATRARTELNLSFPDPFTVLDHAFPTPPQPNL